LQASPMKTLFLFGLVVTVYLSLNLVRLEGLLAYLVPAVCWGLVALSAVLICGFSNIQKWLNQNVVLAALLIGVSQVIILVFVSFFTGFAKSPYQFTTMTIALNVTYFFLTLLGSEFSRASFIRSFSKRRIVMGIGLIGLFYAFMRFSTTSFLTLGAPADTLRFFGSSFLPTLAESVLATFLALLGGPVASIAYLGSLDAVQWLSPILPNPEWTIRALIDTLAPTLGLLAVIKMTSPFALVRSGIISRSDARPRIHRTKKSFPLSWTAIIIAGAILVWSSTGLLGFKPSVVASGSMTPALEVGDLSIVTRVNLDTIRLGDIIQYVKDGEIIIHRVIEIQDISKDTKVFITKGDANTIADSPVPQAAVLGKAILIIPKVGWISIYLRTAAVGVFEFFAKSLEVAYAVLAIAVASSIFAIHRYRNQSLRRVRRRFGR